MTFDLLFQSNSVGATSEVGKAKQQLVERGQKLNEIEDRTEQMANEAKVKTSFGIFCQYTCTVTSKRMITSKYCGYKVIIHNIGFL